ncbi:MAG: AI-2E family transporter [Nanoarchaeota archaeon]
MEENNLHKHSQYFFIICFIAIFLFSLYLIRSYVITIVYSSILVYIFYPVYRLLRNATKSRNLAALLATILIVIIIIIPIVFVANALINESVQFFKKVKGIDLGQFDEKLSDYFSNEVNLDEYITGLLNKFSLSIAKTTSDFIVSLPKKILEVFVMLFTMFYFFKEGNKFFIRIRDHIPLKESHRRDIAKKFSNVIYACLYGIVVTAFIQGMLGAIGLWIFNVSNPLLWGMVMVILSMLPFIGAWLIWLPASLYKVFSGDLFNGFGLLLYGLLIVSTIDNIIRPKIIGSKGKVHPVLVLLGVLGGLEVFGLLGIIIGPLILSILEAFFEIYILERVEKKQTV